MSALIVVVLIAAAVTEFTPEQKKNPQLGIKKKRPANAKKLLRARPAKYHFLIPAKTVDVARKEIEQRQKPVRVAPTPSVDLRVNANRLAALTLLLTKELCEREAIA